MKDLTLQENFIKFCEALSFPVLVFDRDMTVLGVNKEFLDKFGMKEGSIFDKKCHQILFHSDHRCPELECPIDILFAERKRVSATKKTKMPDGSDFYENLIYSPILGDDGEIEYIVVTIKDITRAKHMESDLARTKKFLENIIEGSGHAIIVFDVEGSILLMNESARKLFGYSDRDAISARKAKDLLTRAGFRNLIDSMRNVGYSGAGKIQSMKAHIIHSSGEEIPVEVTASIIYERGEESAYVSIFQDLRPKIEEEKEKERARMHLIQSEKLASIGRLAAGVAHEINNPLGGIIMYANLVLEELVEGSMLRQNLTKVISQAERCKKIVRALLDFSRQQEPRTESIDTNGIIEEIFSILESHPEFQDIEIIKDLDPNLPCIMGDKSQLQQVFINIMLNAAESMSSGGKLIVKSRSKKQFIELKFTDTGPGIPPEYKEKVFEPFFTTKSGNKGSGLGLAISHGIISKHKGTISFETIPNEGTTFTITLPKEQDDTCEYY